MAIYPFFLNFAAMNRYEVFFQLLRLSLGITNEPVKVNPEEWPYLYQIAVKQSSVGICYVGVLRLPDTMQPPLQTALQWATEAESIKGWNQLLNKEAARLTQFFKEKGHQTAVLKGQANARLYPDKFYRQSGDIDLWVDGGKEKVIDLLYQTGMIKEENFHNTSYHHVHLKPNEQGIVIEIHFRPASGNYNPFSNKRLQHWLEEEIKHTTLVEENFCVPTICFALIMQLAHIQRHLLSSGIGLRQIVDYYWLLQEATKSDRDTVAQLIQSFDLKNTAEALMWVLGYVLKLDPTKYITKPDERKGQWMLSEIMTGGNFGWYNYENTIGVWQSFFQSKLHRLKKMRYYSSEIVWMEIYYWKTIIKTLPVRIRYRTLSLKNIGDDLE